MDERLPPRVQDGEEPDLRAQVPGIRRDGPERFGDRAEHDPIDDRFVVEGDRGNRGRHGEDDVKVGTVEQVGRAGQGLARLALRGGL